MPPKNLAENFRSSQQLIYHLRNLGHPAILPELYEWTKSPDLSTHISAVKQLNTLTGLKFTSSDKATASETATTNESLWNAWYKTAAPLLNADYDLRSETGRRAWFQAYRQADPATQRLLTRLWFFERQINEPALLRAASEDDEDSPTAKTLLSTLWQQKRLTPATRQAIVARFIRFALLHRPNDDHREHLEFHLVALRDFPFPADSWMDWGSAVAVGRGKLELNSTGNSSNFAGSGPLDLGGPSGGILQGPPIARAAIELREIDYYNQREPGKIFWTHRWTLDPLPFTPRFLTTYGLTL